MRLRFIRLEPHKISSKIFAPILSVHLSGCREGEACLLPGAGDFDLAGFRRLLERAGYQGAVVTEVYRSGFGEPGELEKSRAVLEKAFGR